MRHHIYLACVELTFVDKDGDTGVTRCNSMIRSNRQAIGVEHLARAQQGAVIQLGEKLGEPQLNILNAVFLNTSYLGHMTEEEFNRRTPVTGDGQATIRDLPGNENRSPAASDMSVFEVGSRGEIGIQDA